MAKSRAAKRKRKRREKPFTDKHALYESAVQCVEADVDFVERVYKKRNGKLPRDLREDFCGTAALACEWVRRDEGRRAWGLDLDGPTLAWGREHRLGAIGDAAQRVHLAKADVLDCDAYPVDIAVAMNFSFCVFRERDDLLRYFRAVRRSLRPGGVFVLDIFGGEDAMGVSKETTPKPAEKQIDGRRVPAFKYVWEQAKFNPIDHEIVCHIHFRLRGGKTLRRAFTYHWRLWTLPELRDLLREAGFAGSDVYVEGWDDEADESDGVFRKRKRFENQAGWIAYVVGNA
jgi:SAM-dependent methyltransferase